MRLDHRMSGFISSWIFCKYASIWQLLADSTQESIKITNSIVRCFTSRPDSMLQDDEQRTRLKNQLGRARLYQLTLKIRFRFRKHGWKPQTANLTWLSPYFFFNKSPFSSGSVQETKASLAFRRCTTISAIQVGKPSLGPTTWLPAFT